MNIMNKEYKYIIVMVKVKYCFRMILFYRFMLIRKLGFLKYNEVLYFGFGVGYLRK